MNYIIDDIFKILSDDTIYIPKSVAQRSDVYDVSKTLFGVIFTDCVDDTDSGNSTGAYIYRNTYAWCDEKY